MFIWIMDFFHKVNNACQDGDEFTLYAYKGKLFLTILVMSQKDIMKFTMIWKM